MFFIPKFFKRRFFPKSLLARFMLIIIVPTLIGQLLAVHLFYQRHWYNVSHHTGTLISGEVSSLIHAADYEKYPNEKEGAIDKKFANLVNKKTCSLIAKKINLKKFLSLGASHKKLERSANKIISDCLEAIVGAIYLDGGLKFAEKFILNFWKSHLEQSIITLVDSKTQLQEFSLKKFKELPKYIFHKKTGPEHQPLFKTEVQIPNSKKISGIGSSKKNAQQNAASKLLKILNI